MKPSIQLDTSHKFSPDCASDVSTPPRPPGRVLDRLAGGKFERIARVGPRCHEDSSGCAFTHDEPIKVAHRRDGHLITRVQVLALHQPSLAVPSDGQVLAAIRPETGSNFNFVAFPSKDLTREQFEVFPADRVERRGICLLPRFPVRRRGMPTFGGEGACVAGVLRFSRRSLPPVALRPNHLIATPTRAPASMQTMAIRSTVAQKKISTDQTLDCPCLFCRDFRASTPPS